LQGFRVQEWLREGLGLAAREPLRVFPMKALIQAYKSLLEKHKDVVLILAGSFKYAYEKSTNNISMRCRQPYSERCSS
jgi:hypothetical protein